MNVLAIVAGAAILCGSLLGVYGIEGQSFSLNSRAGAPVQQQQDAGQAPADVQEKIKALASANPSERVAAACVLAEMEERATAAIPALIGLLGDDTKVDSDACWHKGWRHDKVEGINDKTSPGEQAAHALARIGRASVEPLIAVLKSSDLQVRRNATFALGVIKDERTLDAVLGMVNDQAWQVREQAAWGLGLKRDTRVVEPLITALSDNDVHVRRQAAWALGLQGRGQAVEALINALKDTDADVRSQAAWALGLKGDARAVEPLVVALSDSDPHVRGQAAWALGLKGDERAVLPLANALKDQDSEVRKQAAWALGLKGDKRAVQPLTVALKDTDEEVRKQAAWALRLLRLKGSAEARAETDINVEIK